MHGSSTSPRWVAVSVQECFRADIWASLWAGLSHFSLCVFLGQVWWRLLSELFYMQRQVRGIFSVYVCKEGQSQDKECVNYYLLNSRLKEERLTWWKAVIILLRDMAERYLRDGFSREEIKQNIQYDLICEHNFVAVFEIIVRALSLCLLVLLHSQPCKTDENKHMAYMEAIPFSFI